MHTPPLPKHIAVIMDGNGRWAQHHQLPRVNGHRKGAQALKEIIKACVTKKIPYLTVYAFSSENWQRPVPEIRNLMNLFQHYMETEEKELISQNICLRVIGERSKLPPHLQERILQIEGQTKSNRALTLQIALSYGGRAELTRAFRLLGEKIQEGALDPRSITEQMVTQHLYTHNLPDPDLLIRTSGEQRLSNYLLWQLAYTELYFSPKYWPDFTAEDLDQAIQNYQKRERRFGKAA